MADISLNLVVIRSSDIDRSAQFYGSLGLHLEKHQHGKGPLHYTADLPAAIFEIYPRKTDADSTTAVRLGFRVVSIHTILEALQKAGGKITSEPQLSEWGLRSVVEDPDGHRIELTEA